MLKEGNKKLTKDTNCTGKSEREKKTKLARREGGAIVGLWPNQRERGHDRHPI